LGIEVDFDDAIPIFIRVFGSGLAHDGDLANPIANMAGTFMFAA
jgi:hypothetical protein